VTSGTRVGILFDNTVATAGSLSCTATLTSSGWKAVGIEIRQ
jgi:hypothetical protein